MFRRPPGLPIPSTLFPTTTPSVAQWDASRPVGGAGLAERAGAVVVVDDPDPPAREPAEVVPSLLGEALVVWRLCREDRRQQLLGPPIAGIADVERMPAGPLRADLHQEAARGGGGPGRQLVVSGGEQPWEAVRCPLDCLNCKHGV